MVQRLISIDEDMKLEEMKNLVMNSVANTEEFSEILPHFHFGEGEDEYETEPTEEEIPLNDELNKTAENHFFMRKNPEFVRPGESNEYLLTMLTSKMKIKDIGEKIAAASKKGLYSTFILFKHLNSEGDFFRRTTRVDRDKGEVNYRETNAYAKKSLAHLDHITRNSVLNLSELERGVMKELTDNRVPYIQMESARLEEQLFLIQQNPVRAKYNWGQTTLQKYAIPKKVAEVDELTLFTLVPNNYANQEAKIVRLESAMRGKYDLKGALGDSELKIARILVLPKIMDAYIEDEEDIILRANIALVNEAMSKGEKGKISISLIQKIESQLQEGDALSDAYNSLANAYEDTREQFRSTITRDGLVFTEKHESKSKPGTMHTTTVNAISERPDEWQYECKPCPGYNRWTKCWHTNKIKNDVWNILKKE